MADVMGSLVDALVKALLKKLTEDPDVQKKILDAILKAVLGGLGGIGGGSSNNQDPPLPGPKPPAQREPDELRLMIRNVVSPPRAGYESIPFRFDTSSDPGRILLEGGTTSLDDGSTLVYEATLYTGGVPIPFPGDYLMSYIYEGPSGMDRVDGLGVVDEDGLSAKRTENGVANFRLKRYTETKGFDPSVVVKKSGVMRAEFPLPSGKRLVSNRIASPEVR